MRVLVDPALRVPKRFVPAFEKVRAALLVVGCLLLVFVVGCGTSEASGGDAGRDSANDSPLDAAPSDAQRPPLSGALVVRAGSLVRGSADGTGPAAGFSYPTGVAVDSAGNAFVTDSNNAIIRKITSTGVVTTIAGTAGARGNIDGTGSGARFANAYGIAVDGAGNLFVADTGNHAVRRVTSGGVVTTVASNARDDGGTADVGFVFPLGVAVDSAGNVFVADANSYTIRKITSGGVVSTLAGHAGLFGSDDGTGSAAFFNLPSGVAVDGAGNVFVADTGNHTIRKITSAGVVSTLAGGAQIRGSADGIGSAARFNQPQSLAVDGAGNVFVSDTANFTIRKITSAGVVTTVAGVVAQQGVRLGPLPAGLNFVGGIGVTTAGNLVVTSEDFVLDVLF